MVGDQRGGKRCAVFARSPFIANARCRLQQSTPRVTALQHVAATALQGRNAVSPIGVEAGNGVAHEEAERLGGATVGVGYLAGNLSDRAPDARAYAQSQSSLRFSLRGAKMVPGTVRQT
jgi:hypothetical protein